MKNIKRIISGMLAALFFINASAFDISAWTWGEVTSISDTTVAPGATYHKMSVNSPIGPQSINAIEFNPLSEHLELRAGMSNGFVNGSQTVVGMATDFNKKGEGQVVAGINGDFFNMGQGVPFGIFMDEGEILSTPPAYSAAFGIRNDGTAFCQSHGTILDKILTVNDVRMQLSGINNRHSGSDSLILYNDKFATSTKSADDSVEVLLEVLQGEFKHGETLILSVCEIYEKGNNEIPEGKVILSARGVYKDTLLSLLPEQEITLELRFVESWADVKFAIAGDRQILKNGEPDNVSGSERAPRTVIGVKPDGNVIFYTIDGRLSDFSVGATYKQAATIIRDLGCVDAINLDGGGSTTFALRYLGAMNPKMINRSADKAARAVANSLLLVNTAPLSEPEQIMLSTPAPKLLLGSSFTVTAIGGMDKNYLSYELENPLSWWVDEAIGTISEEGVFTPYTTGDAYITATDGDISGNISVSVLDTVDQIIAPDSLTIKAEETQTIPVSLSHAGDNVWFSIGQLDWQVDGDIGTFTEPGIFVATNVKATGTITVTLGDVSKTIEVTIDGPDPEELEPFKDMDAHLWAKEALYRLYDAGVIRGVSDTEFAPAREIKRADFMLMLVRLMDIEIDTAPTEQFDDVPVGSYYYNELATAKRLGIARGTSDTTFAPERSITRQEMFTLTWRVLNMKEQADIAALNAFADKDLIAEYAKQAIATLTKNGLIAGDNKGYVNPSNSATRAEAAVFLDRVYSQIKGAEVNETENSEAAPQDE